MRHHAKRNAPTALLVLGVLTVAILFGGQGESFHSSEVKFADTSKSGLSIVPASCPSDPHSPGAVSSWGCYGNYVAGLDECGSTVVYSEYCSYGCSGGSCNAPACYQGVTCHGNDRYYYNQAGSLCAYIDSCPYSCSNGSCILPPPASCSIWFSANPINQPNSSYLSWSTSNPPHYWVYISNIGYVGASGGTWVAPAATTDYSCLAYGWGGYDGWHSYILYVNRSCSLPWGGTIQHGSGVTAYAAPSVSYGQSCASQWRSCYDSSLDGSYTHPTCSVQPPANCTFNGQTVSHGSSVTAFEKQTIGLGETCVSQQRQCSNGSMLGSYQHDSCSCVSTPRFYCTNSAREEGTGASYNYVTHMNDQCTAAYAPANSLPICTSPSFCSAGSASCLDPTPIFSQHLQIRPQLVNQGSPTKVFWSVSNVNSCTVRGSNSDGDGAHPTGDAAWNSLSSATNGKTTSAITQKTIYTLTCTKIDNTTFTETATVSVTPVFQEK